MKSDLTYEEAYELVLARIIPAEACPVVAKYLMDNKIYLEKTRRIKQYWGLFCPRHTVTKSGQVFTSIIQLNSELRPTTALMVLLHEMSHHSVWVRYELRGKKVRSHGKEFRDEYCKALARCVEFFPECIHGDLGYLMKHYSNRNENRITDWLQEWESGNDGGISQENARNPVTIDR